jgi:predicted metal-dependent peptidase
MLVIGKPLTANQRLFKATTDLIGRDEFIALAGVLMIGTKQVVDGLPTACTNGRDEMYGREFVAKLGEKELAFVILHEAMHKCYRHLTTWRKLWEDEPMLANAAMDYVINLELEVFIL